jgi:hypothetical protein
MRTRLLLAALCLAPAPLAWAVDVSVTVLPNATIRYRGEAKHVPQSYVNRFSGISSPVYRVEVSQTPSRRGYWSLSLLHTGEFGGGEFAMERVPDNTSPGTDYQVSQLNIGFDNTSVTYHRAIQGWPVEALVNLSIMRGFYKRKQFIVQGTDIRATGFDHVNELSAEGFGFGLAGRHGDRWFVRWQTAFNYYVQLADAKTDASYGQVFQMEGGLGARVWRGLSLEFGGFRQYWFIPGPGDRVSAPGNHEAIVAWERQLTWTHGAYVRLDCRFHNP